MKEEISIFETIAPGEVYILTRVEDCVEYLVNVDGGLFFKKACLEKSDE